MLDQWSGADAILGVSLRRASSHPPVRSQVETSRGERGPAIAGPVDAPLTNREHQRHHACGHRRMIDLACSVALVNSRS